MSVKDLVQYESQSLKQYTKGSETEIIWQATVVIKMKSAERSHEYKRRQKECRLENLK